MQIIRKTWGVHGTESAMVIDDAKRAQTPRGALKAATGGEKAAGSGPWRAPAHEVFVVGILGTMALLVLLFGTGRGGSLSPSMLPGMAFVRSPAAAAASPDDKPAHGQDQDARLLGGLLSAAFDDEQSCRSRYASSLLYRTPSPFRPSRHLVDRLRRYEARHRRCGPGSPWFKQSVEHLRSGRNAARPECQYVVWTPFNGLGNRMLALASTFLYALLTDRVLLVHSPQEFDGLFCEPFPGSSWKLPDDGFPITDFEGTFTMSSPSSYKNMRQAGALQNATAEKLPAYVFLDLIQSYTDAAFCEADQRALAGFSWMVIKSDVYFAAMFFLMPSYGRELARLFPEKEAVFHHLARYLFHPSNAVWGIVVRGFYKDYDLAGADERVGLQVRVFPETPVPFDAMYGQIVRCAEQQQGLLPKVVAKNENESSSVGPPGSGKKKLMTSILVTSLSSGYYERLRGVYGAAEGRVAVHQPSQEGEQRTEARAHNQRALAEMYLLSSCDRVVATAVSTFGYVAHGLAGARPWLLLRPPAEPACVRSSSAEPCMHAPPPRVCGAAEGSSGVGALVPYLRHCEDVPRGVKLFG